LTKSNIQIENIVSSANFGKDMASKTVIDKKGEEKEVKIDLDEVSKNLEGVTFNSAQFPGLVFKLPEPKTAHLIFSSGKLVCTGAKSIKDSKIAINETVDLMRVMDEDIPTEFDIKIQNIVASANLGVTLNLEIIALEVENTEYEPEQFPGLVFRVTDPKVVLLLFGSGKVVCTGAKTFDDAKVGVEKTQVELRRLKLI
jgi:transcription initiation factor TFIID TATA-box-binding protein